MMIRIMTRGAFAAAGLASLLLGGPSTRADVVVAPNANESVAGGGDNRFPFLVDPGMRYQQVFDASQFASLAGPQYITQFALRNGIFVSTAFSATIADIVIRLSTTDAAPDALSTTFADNLGADATVVYDGSLTISSTDAAGPGNTKVFDVIVTLETPFLYDPGLGNLLLDVQNISGADAFVELNFFDAVDPTGDPVSRVFSLEGNPDATSGIADSVGLIVQFTTAVPEPSSLALVGVGFAGTLAFVRRRRAGVTA